MFDFKEKKFSTKMFNVLSQVLLLCFLCVYVHFMIANTVTCHTGTIDERFQLLVEDVLPGTLRPAVPPPGTAVSTGDSRVVYVPAGGSYELMCSEGEFAEVLIHYSTTNVCSLFPVPHINNEKSLLYLPHLC